MGSEARLYWIVGGAAGAIVAATWLTGALSAALFGAGWAGVPALEAISAAVRLPSHLADPRAAWPRGIRAELPGALGFYATAALIASPLAGLALAARRGAARIEPPPFLAGARARKPPSARFARKRDLRALRVPSPQPGRLTLGRAKGMLLAAEERQSVIVFAPTQAFKTSSLVIPALLEWEGPVVATSVKNDLLADTLARRESLGEVMIFDPAQVTGGPRSRLTPLWSARSWWGATRVAHWLTGAARLGGSGGFKDADFWFAAAEKLLAPLLFAAAANGHTMASVVRWLDEGPEGCQAEVTALLEATEVHEATRAWWATQNREARQLSSVFTTAELALAAFADPRVAEETAGADYTPARLLNGPNTLYLCAPRSEQERLRPLFAAVVQELVAIAEGLAASTGGPLDPPLLLLLDEAANIAPIPNLDEIASTGAGQGIQLLSVFQDLAQVRVRFGERATTIVNNHAAKIAGSGISDPETLSYFSNVIGAGEFEQRSETSGEHGRRTRTEGDTYRELIPPGVLRGADPGSGLLIYRHLPPTKIQLRPWFREPTLKELRQAAQGVRQSGGSA